MQINCNGEKMGGKKKKESELMKLNFITCSLKKKPSRSVFERQQGAG